MYIGRSVPISPALWILLAAGGALFVTGNQGVWATALFFTLAGLVMVVCPPSVRPGRVAQALGVLFLLSGLLAFLPQAWFPEPAWRSLFPAGGSVPLADSVSPQPWLGWYWWFAQVGIFLVGAFVLSRPLEGRTLAVFLHGVALVVAAFAVLSIFSWQSGWKFPFDFDGAFGFLANKNHTATVLFVGAIVSFGLMQWETMHGYRGAAVSAALCGAPPLAGLLFFSNSRAGVVFLAFGIVLWAIGAARGEAWRKVLAAAVILVVFLGVLFSFGDSEVRNRLVALGENAVAVNVDQENGDVDFRQPIFRDAVKILKDAPLTGIGLGQFVYVFPQYRVDSARAAVVLHPESSWLMSACEAGLISVLALLGAVVWFFRRCWKSRDADDGMLRWTAASAIGAAVAHGLIDVPWHLPALGWFLFVIAMAIVPSSRLEFRRPALARALALLAGFTVMAGGAYVGWERFHYRYPLPLSWNSYTKELTELGKQGRNDEGEFVAAEAIRHFPLKHEAHYWLVGYLRMFLETGPEIDVATKAGRMVEPILPRVAVDQAILWQNLDPLREAEAWGEAVRRALRLDMLVGQTDLPGASSQVQAAFASLRERPEGQAILLRQISETPVLAAQGFRFAAPEVATEWLATSPDPVAFLEALPVTVRLQVLDRWIGLPDPSIAVAYMEGRNVAGSGLYWRTLARYYAGAGDKPRAVEVVAQAAGVSLEGGWRSRNDFGREIAALEAQGNEVAVRRLLKEAVEAKTADAAKLSVAMAAYAAAGDWEMAWKAASRLASEAKLAQ